MTKGSGFQVASSSRPIRERVGLNVDGTNAAAAVRTIVAAEAAGVRQIWMDVRLMVIVIHYSYQDQIVTQGTIYTKCINSSLIYMHILILAVHKYKFIYDSKYH